MTGDARLENDMTEWDAGRTQKEILALRAEVNDLKAADLAVAGAIQEIRAKLGDLEKRLTTTVENPGGTPGQGAPPEPLPDPNSNAAALRMLLADLVQFCQGEDRGVVDVPVSLLRNAEQWLRRLAKEVVEATRHPAEEPPLCAEHQMACRWEYYGEWTCLECKEAHRLTFAATDDD